MTDMQHLQHNTQHQAQLFQQQQQMQPQAILNSIDCLQLNDQIQIQPVQPIMELVSPQQIQNFGNFCTTTQNGDIKIIQQQTSQPQQQQQQQQQQPMQQQAQIHTFMINGQPALFIPSSSSGILCQMLNNQIYEIVQPQQQQLQLQIAPNSNDFATILGNNGANNNNNTIMNNIQLATNQNGGLTLIQIPGLTTTNGNNLNNNSNETNQQQQIICKVENSSDDYIIQQQTQQFLQQNLNINGHIDLNNKKQKRPKGPMKINNRPEPKKPKKIIELVNDMNMNGSINNNNNNLINHNDTNGNINNDNENLNQEFSNFDDEKLGDQLQSTNETNPLEHWLIIEGDLDGTQKRKRKACDCPNCIRWRQNAMTPEEMAKKRTHKCHKCDKEYNKTSHLRAHLRAHDNYRPYVCDFKMCGKSFTRSDELKRHKRIHNDDRNFPCQICKKRFLRSDHLSKHLLVHNKISANSAASTSSSSPSSSLSIIKVNAIE